MPTPALPKKQQLILQRLALGHPYSRICADLGLTQACLHTHTNQIRRKTGILNTRDPEACKAWLHTRSILHTPPHFGPTCRQLEVLRLCAIPRSHAQISEALGITEQTVSNIAWAGAKRLGINMRRSYPRIIMIREKLAELDAKADPMDDPAFR